MLASHEPRPRMSSLQCFFVVMRYLTPAGQTWGWSSHISPPPYTTAVSCRCRSTLMLASDASVDRNSVYIYIYIYIILSWNAVKGQRLHTTFDWKYFNILALFRILAFLQLSKTNEYNRFRHYESAREKRSTLQIFQI